MSPKFNPKPAPHRTTWAQSCSQVHKIGTDGLGLLYLFIYLFINVELSYVDDFPTRKS
jgi:hypothetical protein